MTKKNCRVGWVYGFAFLSLSIIAGICWAAAAQGPGTTGQGKIFDPFVSGEPVLPYAEFEKSTLESAAEANIPPNVISAILQDFRSACVNRIVRPQEWRYLLLDLSYKNNIPYENARKLLLKLRFSPVDTGFLSYMQELRATEGGTDSGNAPYVAGTFGVTAPVVLDQPLPQYTPEARQARAEGIVLLKAVITKDGSVKNPVVLRGLGYGLDESAIQTLMTKWRFNPGTRDGIPVDVQANIEISFRLY